MNNSNRLEEQVMSDVIIQPPAPFLEVLSISPSRKKCLLRNPTIDGALHIRPYSYYQHIAYFKSHDNLAKELGEIDCFLREDTSITDVCWMDDERIVVIYITEIIGREIGFYIVRGNESKYFKYGEPLELPPLPFTV